MSFLAPLFLAGALAVVLPVVFHLIRRTTRQRTTFSSLMFLKATLPRLTRRNRLEHILLLFLRCAAICLLAFGFARPFVKHAMPGSATSEPPKRVVVLLDTSASMRRGNLWTEARSEVKGILRKTSPADQVAIVAFDRESRSLVGFDEWKATAAAERVPLAENRLAQLKPGWASTRLDRAVLRAVEMLTELDRGNAPGPGQIVVVSDFQEGSKLNSLQGHEWPKGIDIVSKRVIAKSGNAGIQLLAQAKDGPGSAAGVRVRVSNEANSKREQFQVGWAGSDGNFIGEPKRVYVPAGQSRILALPLMNAKPRPDRITLRGDEEAFDNTVFTRPPEPSRVTVIYIGKDSPTEPREPLYFVRRALEGTPRQVIQIVAKPPDAQFVAGEADGARLFIVTDGIAERLAAVLRAQLERGKTVLFSPANAEAAKTLGILLRKDVLAVSEGAPRSYAMLGEIDFRHPVFAPFADPRYSDFTKIHFWKYRRLDPAAFPEGQVIARFDNGDAAIVDVPVGKGRVIFFASGWRPEDSQLALSTKFVPLLSSILELSGGESEAPTQFVVGDAIPLAFGSTSEMASAEVRLPDGASVKVGPGEHAFTQASMPGVYRVKNAAGESQFAVNLDAEESRTAPLPLDELERLGAPTETPAVTMVHAARQRLAQQSAELEDRQKLWRWFIVATLGVLLVETGVAGWIARKGPRADHNASREAQELRPTAKGVEV